MLGTNRLKKSWDIGVTSTVRRVGVPGKECIVKLLGYCKCSTTRAESLGEGVVAENTIGGALLRRFEAVSGMSLCRGNGLFDILVWAF
jgi:hypothetical protein